MLQSVDSGVWCFPTNAHTQISSAAPVQKLLPSRSRHMTQLSQSDSQSQRFLHCFWPLVALVLPCTSTRTDMHTCERCIPATPFTLFFWLTVGGGNIQNCVAMYQTLMLTKQDLKYIKKRNWLWKSFMRWETYSACLLDCNDRGSVFWCVALDVNITQRGTFMSEFQYYANIFENETIQNKADLKEVMLWKPSGPMNHTLCSKSQHTL